MAKGMKFAVLVALGVCKAESDVSKAFEDFITKFEKSYATKEEPDSFSIWLSEWRRWAPSIYLERVGTELVSHPANQYLIDGDSWTLEPYRSHPILNEG